jgi:hypothetical protein
MMDSLIISLALNVITSVVKNPTKREKLKSILLSMRNAINAAYPEE